MPRRRPLRTILLRASRSHTPARDPDEIKLTRQERAELIDPSLSDGLDFFEANYEDWELDPEA